MHKRLYRSSTNKIFGGVMGGLGEYFDIDPTILRLAYLLIAFATHVGPAILAYVIAWIIVPKHLEIHHVHHTEKKD